MEHGGGGQIDWLRLRGLWSPPIRVAKNGLRFLWIVSNNIYSISAYFWILFIALPMKWSSESGERLFRKLEELLFGVLLTHVSSWNASGGYRIAESGDSLDDAKDDSFLFIPNHQSTADVPLCMSIFAHRPRVADKVMWIMDRVFKFTNFGAVAWMHHDFFILAGKENRDKSLLQLKNHLREVFIPKERKYLVLFPEGGFLRNRKQKSHEFAQKNNLPKLDYVSLPRTGALEVIMDVLCRNKSPKITKIVDITIAYPDQKPLDLTTIAFGYRPPCTTNVLYRVFDTKDVPTDPEETKSWMYRLYTEKERFLKEYYETGIWPYDMFNSNANPPTILEPNLVLYIVTHILSILTFISLVAIAHGVISKLQSLQLLNIYFLSSLLGK